MYMRGICSAITIIGNVESCSDCDCECVYVYASVPSLKVVTILEHIIHACMHCSFTQVWDKHRMNFITLRMIVWWFGKLASNQPPVYTLQWPCMFHHQPLHVSYMLHVHQIPHLYGCSLVYGQLLHNTVYVAGCVWVLYLPGDRGTCKCCGPYGADIVGLRQNIHWSLGS